MKTILSSISLSVFHRILLAWAMALFLCIALAMAGVGGALEEQLRDTRGDFLEKPATGQIVLVEIDAKSLQATGQWPWPRENYAQLIENLNQAGVAQIAFDIDFSAHSSPAQDQLFAKAIANSDATIILPTFRQPGFAGASSDVESLPIEEFRKNAFLASVNVHPDKRGQLNQYSFGTVTDGNARPSLASMVAETSGNINDSFLIDQMIDPATIPRFSFVDLIGSDQQAAGGLDKLKDAKVIVGATAIELGDHFATSRFGLVPGVVIQTLAAETLLQGTNIYHLGGYPPLALAALVIFMCIIRKFSDAMLTGFTWAIGLTLFGSLIAAEYFSLFTFSNVPAFFFLAIFLVIRKLLTTSLALKTSRFYNKISKLPNEAAMQKFTTDLEGRNIATARISNFHELLVITNNATRIELFNGLADRLKFLAHGERIFHVDSDIFAWVVKSDYDADVPGHFETANALFQSPLIAGDVKVKISATFGVSCETIEKSIVASEHASATGKRWVSHDDDVDQIIGQKLNMLVELEQAIQNGEMHVVYQPKWDIAADQLSGAEALVRWLHPEQGMVSPALFIPILEKAGRIEELTCFVLQETLKDFAEWEHRRPGLSCSVNISAQLLDDRKFVAKAIAMVEASNLRNEQLTFEVTETEALADLDLSIQALSLIRDAGIKISIDDYGTGQSTMSYLQRLPVNEIKIDQSFVKTMTTDNANRVMVNSTIEMGHALGFKVVAEGIEDQQCLDLLKELGCDVGQGWHISKPIATEEFEHIWLDVERDEALKSA